MLYYKRIGNSPNKTIMLHGFMENHRIWEDLLVHLCKNTEYILVDLPSHGNSIDNNETLSMEYMAEKIKELMDWLGIGKANLIGHSMGGYVALSFAEKYPLNIEKLVLFFSHPFADSEEKKEQRKKSIPLILNNFDSFARIGIPNLFSEKNRVVLKNKIEQAITIALSNPKEGIMAAQNGMIIRNETISVLENKQLKCLWLLGNEDTAIPKKESIKLANSIKHINLQIVPCGHNGQWECPEICAKSINELLKT